jgi:hypothetical protein
VNRVFSKTLEGLRIGEPKLHWHCSNDQRRAELVAAVARLPVTGLVVVHVDKDADDRRHRRKCMEFLVPHLAQIPCTTITFESRGRLDSSDLATMQLLCSRRHRIHGADRTCSGPRRTSAFGKQTLCVMPWFKLNGCRLSGAAQRG